MDSKYIYIYDEESYWHIYVIGELSIAKKHMGILGTNNSSPTVITPPVGMSVFGITITSAHTGIYATYKHYISNNKVYAYFIGNSTGHSSTVTLIGSYSR